jgi:hypothetical protein
MLNKTTTLESLIDFALLQLWYANDWSNTKSLPKDIRDENAIGFRSQATGIVQFIYMNMTSPTHLIDYDGIKIPENLLEYFEERKKFYKHPK